MNKPFNDSCNSHDPWGRRSREGLEYVGNHPGDELEVVVVDHLYPFLIDLLMAEWVAKSTAKSRGLHFGEKLLRKIPEGQLHKASENIDANLL